MIKIFAIVNLMIVNAMGFIAAMSYFQHTGNVFLFFLSGLVGINMACLIFWWGLG